MKNVLIERKSLNLFADSETRSEWRENFDSETKREQSFRFQNNDNRTEENATPGWNGFSRGAMERGGAEPWKAGLVFD